MVYELNTGTAEFLDNATVNETFEHTITGGTGRFAGAAGSFVPIGFANENTGTAKATFTGTIS